MDKHITIAAIIDARAALQQGKLKDNIYLIDSESHAGSCGEGSGNLITHIENGFLIDGSQTEAVVINWCIAGMENMTSFLPRYYADYYKRKLRRRALRNVLECGNVDKATPEFQLLSEERANRYAPASLLGFITGGEENDCLIPNLVNITGEAVDRGILYPARYGTPVPVDEGWYWSASVNTYTPGTYGYTMHIDFYKSGGKERVPVRMEHEAFINISNAPQQNGFTSAGLGLLPIRCDCETCNKENDE